ncbi:MAG: CerR family C-terminal domain-containing protein [Syntrophales bacterium]|jgi:AcrR family transcriptional regulator|nr:CerR family C-terminal domain-containing protein [Syntrophales bacterium]
MSPDNKGTTTRERLLKVAETLFAQKGYDAVSVREITNAAHCNLAAVNYHFGNKKTLYLHMFRERWMSRAQRIRACFGENLAHCADTSPASVIKSLAEALIKGPLTDEERLRHFQLIIREMTKPTEAFEIVVEETMKPSFEGLEQLFRPCLHEGIDEERTLLNVLSIFSMVLYFNFARLPVSKIIGHAYDEPFKDRLVQHIVQFSLSGMPLKENTL